MTPPSSDDRPLYGRDEDTERVLVGLARRRLVTITGAPGIGKTRLARLVGRRLEGRSRVAIASLEAAETEVDFGAAVARAAGVKLARGIDHASVLGTIGRGLELAASPLLVLDGGERLTAAVARAVETWLGAVPALRVLVASREPLGTDGEVVVTLEPLDEASASRLFLERAELRGPDAATLEVVRAIVRKLDGVPLAVEVAAARAAHLSPRDLLDRLESGAAALHTGPAARGGLARALAASWALLGERERAALSALAVFRGGASLAALARVTGEPDALDVAESLVVRSLARRVGGAAGRARLGTFEVVRAYAEGRLEPAARAAIEDAHAECFLALAESLASRAYGPGAEEALAELTSEAANVTVAFSRSRAERPARAARLAIAMTDAAVVSGGVDLRGPLFVDAVECAERCGDEAILARALTSRAKATLETGSVAEAIPDLTRARAIARGELAADVDRSLGWALLGVGRLDEARACLSSAAEVHAAGKTARGEADALAALGVLERFLGDTESSWSHLCRAFEIHTREGDAIRQAKILSFVDLAGHDKERFFARFPAARAIAAVAEVEAEALRDRLSEAATGHEREGRRWRAAIDAYRLGALEHERGDLDAAASALARAEADFEAAGMDGAAAVCRAHAGAVLADRGLLADAEAAIARARREVARLGETTAVDMVSALEAFVDLEKARVSPDAAPAHLARARERAALGESRRARFADVAVGPLVTRRLAALAPASPAPPAASGPALRATQECREVALPSGERVDLVRHGALRRVLEALVAHRLARPGHALGVQEVIALGWPGEKVLHQAATLRVYTAVRRLRKLGLASELVTRDDGYLLDPALPVERVEKL